MGIFDKEKKDYGVECICMNCGGKYIVYEKLGVILSKNTLKHVKCDDCECTGVFKRDFSTGEQEDDGSFIMPAMVGAAVVSSVN